MFIIFILGFISIVDGGLFDLASRQGGIEPLWQQVKALERVNMFLEEVQEEIKESRDLLRHINFKNFFNYSSIKSVNESFVGIANWNMSIIGEKSTIMSAAAEEVTTPATTRSTTIPVFTSLKSALNSSMHTAGSTKPATPNPVNETPETINYDELAAKQSALNDNEEATPTQFIRQGPEVRNSIIPDVEPEYKEILPYFRDEGRHILDQENYRDVNKKNYNKKYPQNKLSEKRMPYDKIGVLYSKNVRTATFKRNTPRYLASVSLTPLYRNIIAVKDYVLSKKTLKLPTKSKYSQYKVTRQLKNLNEDKTNIRDVKSQFSHEIYSDKIQDTQDVLYNNFKNYGQKRFNIVTPPWRKDKYRLDEDSRDIQREFKYAKLYSRPTAEAKRLEANRPLLVQRASNEYLRKITGASSYSDEETALKVNLLDQLYHYNKTYKTN